MILAVDYRQEISRALQDDVISLMGGVLQGGKNVFAFQEWIVGQNLVEGSSGAQEFQNIADAHSESANAGASTTLTHFNGDAIEALEIHGILLEM